MKSIKKLTLRKETVASLGGHEMKQLRGGSVAIACTCPPCVTDACPTGTCQACPPGYTQRCGGGGGVVLVSVQCTPVIGYSVGYQC